MKLLKQLVGIKSLSGHEGPMADEVESFLKLRGFSPKRWKNNVWAIKQGAISNAVKVKGTDNTHKANAIQSKTILFCSHLDTVETGAPAKAMANGKMLSGLGAVDAKASVAAMLEAFIVAKPKPGTNILIALTQEEETGGKGMPVMAAKLPAHAAAIVGEPTKMQPCIAQKGLLIAKLTVAGKTAHASRPQQGKNAIMLLAEDILRLQKLASGKLPSHPLLGKVTITPTMMTGGSARNVVPAHAEAILDIRTIPGAHQEILTLLNKTVKSTITPLSIRLVPKATAKTANIAKLAAKASGKRFISSTGMSDWAFLSCPAVKIGPGDPTLSHTKQERISETEYKKAVKVYTAIMEEYT